MEEKTNGDVMVVRGLVDHINLDDIRRELRQRLDHRGDVYVDVSEARPVGPSVLMVFVSAARLAARRGKSIHLLNPSMSVRHLLARNKHLGLFVIHDDGETPLPSDQTAVGRVVDLDAHGQTEDGTQTPAPS